MRRLALCALLGLGATACRRADGPAPPAARLPAATAPPASAPAPAAALAELAERVALLEARSRRDATDGGLVAIPGPPGPIGPFGPTGPEGPAGPPGPPVRLDGVPDKHEVYRRRTEQPLEAGETGAAVARCDGPRDRVVSGGCAALPAPIASLVAAGAHGLDDPTQPAGWRCGYRNLSVQRRLTVRTEVYCVARGTGAAPRAEAKAAPGAKGVPRPEAKAAPGAPTTTPAAPAP